MKKGLLMLLVATGLLFTQAKAQVNVNINIASQPVWGPADYDYVDYYYLPDYEVYYSVPQAQFVYLNGGNWVFASTLPSRFGRVDLFGSYKVVINEPRPYMAFSSHKIKYKGYKGRHNKMIIRDSRDSRYYVVKGHPHFGKPAKVKMIDKGHNNGGNNYKKQENGKQGKGGHGKGHKH